VKLENLLDLARLPWFEVRSGRLVLADASIGPIFDCHTHLALAYGWREPNVDLLAETPSIELYLDEGRPIDLDVYMNRNFTRDDLRKIERDMTREVFGGGGMRATHTLPNLLLHMRDVGVTASALLPIDFPFWSKNSERWLALAGQKSEIVCFGSIHPYGRNVRARVARLAAMGARGLKFHPSVQLVAPDDRRAMALYRCCAEHRLPVLFHCGPVGIEPRIGRRLCQVRRYERAIAENPDVDFVLGHAGALQMEEAITFAAKYPNVYYEIASQSLPAVERLIDALPDGRLMLGSDWPFYHPAVSIAKVLLATERSEATRRAVLHGNAARLFHLS
jgi:predicted TIM-barrel fold metal-dependent hydrolase